MRLDEADLGSCLLWAADCAERVLPTFETQHPDDDRPRKAIEAARAAGRVVTATERDGQIRHLPEHLRSVA